MRSPRIVFSGPPPRPLDQLVIGHAGIRSGFALLGQFAEDDRRFGLTTESNRVRFVVNIDTLKQGNMRANARFLQLASRTITASQTPDEILKAVTFSRPSDDKLIQELFGL